MSPVSRSRKPKKNRQSSGGKRSGNPASAKNIPALGERSGLSSGNPFARPSGLSFLQQLAQGQPARRDWFGPSFSVLLDEAEVLLGAEGPRRLEDMTAGLLGARVHQAVQEGRPLALGDWIGGLIDAAEERARERLVSGVPGGQAALLLLYGLSSVGSPAIAHAALEAVSRLRPVVRGSQVLSALPQWRDAVAKLRMTGDIWALRDVYGSRLGVIAATVYPGGMDPAVYLFDIDACGFVVLAGGGTYDDVEQAAEAWRAAVGAAAAGAGAKPLAEAGTEALRCLTEVDLTEISIFGTEPRAVWDEWFRALRRIHDVSAALERRGSSLPAAIDLYHDVDVTPTLEAFTAWLQQRRSETIDEEIVEALVAEWLAGVLPDTADSVSPHRIVHNLTLINDWDSSHPVTIGVKRLLPDWVRFLAWRSGIPQAAADAALATLAEVSAGGHRAAEHCPGVH
ncbi:hypothetical protein ACWCQN_41750 [Streptomyces sp. NPDC001984]|uniref:hypothetical protein n=1 Tax=Streptomyces sp. NPDC002619 TaxID=3364655 RepID=UPI00369A27E1